MPELDGFTYRYEEGEGDATLLLLHGTGGNEDDLVPLAAQLAPGMRLLSPRGKVLEGGMPRFFRRLAEGVFDQEDLARRTEELAGFVGSAAAEHGFEPGKVVALGFSNGANIAASLLLARPGVLAAAALMHAMVPFEPAELPDLSGTPVLLTAGRRDPMIPPDLAQRLADLLGEAGADLELHWTPEGHQPDMGELERVAAWFSALQI